MSLNEKKVFRYFYGNTYYINNIDWSAYWGINFINLPVKEFDVPVLAILRFSFQECHYKEVVPGQSFDIMEGADKVGEGKITSIEEL